MTHLIPHLPGVSHLEPGGLATRDIINIISKLDVDIIGADIVEYNPKMVQQYDRNNGSKAIKELMGKICNKKAF